MSLRFNCFIGRLILKTFAAFILIMLPPIITIVWKNPHSIRRFIYYREKTPNMIHKKLVTDSPPSHAFGKCSPSWPSLITVAVLHDIEQFVARQTGEQICHLVIGPGTTSSQSLSSNQCSFMVTNWREANIICTICRFKPKLDML